MELLNLSKEKKNVIVELSADELVLLCNCMYRVDMQNNLTNYGHNLYADMMTVRDLCQYGHVDDFCFGQIQKHRKAEQI